MLQFIRERAQTAFAWVIIGLIIIPFALWGVQEYMTGGKDKPAVTVNGTGISQQQLQQAYYQQRERIAQMFGGKINPNIISEEQIRKQALDGLVDQQLLIQATEEARMRVGDQELARRIQEISLFQENGRFSQQRYDQVLAARGMTTQSFEASLRRDLLIEQMRDGIRETAFVTPAEIEAQRRLEGQMRDAGYLLLTAKQVGDAGQIPESEQRSYYESHPDQFVRPEQVKLAYIELAKTLLAGNIEISEKDLQDRYQARIDNYRTPEQRRASHILIAAARDADPTKVEEARKKAEQLRSEIDKGVAFAELAKKHSEDPGSATQGGDLGFFARGNMVKEFDEAVFAAQPGQVVGPVRTEFGFHLIRLEEVKPSVGQNFAEARDKLLEEARAEAADQKFYGLAETLNTLAFEHPESLEPAAQKLGVPVKESPFISRNGGTGLFGEPKVQSAAFSEEVLGGNNSELIELDGGRVVVLRVAEHQPEARLSFEEAQPKIVAQLTRERSSAKLKEAADAAAKRLRDGADPAALATELKAEWKRQEVGRRDMQLRPEISKALFAMARPGEGKATVERVELAGGEQAVVALFGVKEAAAAPAQAPQEQQLISDAGDAAFQLFLQGVKARAEIKMGDQAPQQR